MRRLFSVALAATLAAIAGSAGAQTVVSTDITTDTTWSTDVVLAQPIFVKNGATLTILEGVVVRGQPRTAAVAAGVIAGSPGALIVTQNGKINAQGSPTNPIIFTTAAVDNDNDGIPDDDDNNGFLDAWVMGDTFYDDAPKTAPLAPLDKAGNANVSLWGGLVILGNAPTNLADKCGVGYGKCTIEGLTIPGFPAADATYGGEIAQDSSGTLSYVSVRHAGDEIGEGNELNGVSLGGVGSGTVLEYVEVYCNFDDGFEWFGGTVGGEHLAVFFAGDDSFDMDQGYTGVNQFMFAIMPFFNQNSGAAYGSSSGDKAGEWDGDDYDEGGVNNVNTRLEYDGVDGDGTPWPFPGPQIWNLTVIGSTPDGANPAVSAASANRGPQMRNGFSGAMYNSIVVNTGTAQGYDVDAGGTPGFTTPDNIAAGTTWVQASTFDDCGALPGASPELDALANGDAMTDAAGANVYNGAFTGLVDEDDTFDPTGNAAGKLDNSLGTTIDPRPTGLVGVGGGASSIRNPGATYRGAFQASAPELWTTGWTTLNAAGMLVD